MALINCSECAKQFSTDAKACPHCGKKRTSHRGLVFVLVVLFGGLWFISTVASTPPVASVDPPISAIEQARLACNVTLIKQLNDPDSAQLTPSSRWYAEKRKNGTILVQPSGRAKNRFGAYINGTWNCVVKGQDKTLKVVSLDQIVN